MKNYDYSKHYLAVYRDLEPPSTKRGFRFWFDWKKVVLAVLAGGLVGGALAISHDGIAQSSVKVVRGVDPNEVARLETRNRRLEALVWVLRNRDHKESSKP